jgi:hypothetical protein
MRRSCATGMVLAALAAASGCGGQYILTVPDQVARAGGQTTAIVRLQRNDFFVLTPAVKDAPMRFRVADEKERGAFTDKLGYAGTTVPVPARPGPHRLRVTHLDRFGDEVVAEAPVYAWDPNRPVIAVDMDCLPGLTLGSSAQASRALQRLAASAKVLYLTRRSTRRHAETHKMLERAGYPDGPVLAWQQQRWHIVREGRFRLPRVVVESRLVSQLPELRKLFPKMDVGVCDAHLAAEAFAAAGLKVLLVGRTPVDVQTQVLRRNSWADLAARGP